MKKLKKDVVKHLNKEKNAIHSNAEQPFRLLKHLLVKEVNFSKICNKTKNEVRRSVGDSFEAHVKTRTMKACKKLIKLYVHM